jgi:peptidoglycan/xylan/chitin deacetylase (PgdA/CDA1 family)
LIHGAAFGSDTAPHTVHRATLNGLRARCAACDETGPRRDGSPGGGDGLPGDATLVAHRIPGMSPRIKLLFALLGMALQTCAAAADRAVAITIDDLPRGGDTSTERSLPAVRAMTERLLQPFREQRIPVIGFVNEGRRVDFGPEGLREILDLWLDAGADLGNHSYSHLNINVVRLDEFTADIVRGEPLVRKVLAARGRTLRYFRHPFLYTGPTPEIEAGLTSFLDARGYRVAPVTIDDADYELAALYTRDEYRDRVRQEYLPYLESVVAFFEARAVEVVGREFPQVLLLHANQLNADSMPDVLDMFRRRGYAFVSLNTALADDAYALPEDYVGRGGFSWIHRWSRTKGMAPKGEPEPPQWVRTAR